MILVHAATEACEIRVLACVPYSLPAVQGRFVGNPPRVQGCVCIWRYRSIGVLKTHKEVVTLEWLLDIEL